MHSALQARGGHGNSETLVELLASFFTLLSAVCGGWVAQDEATARCLRRVRIDAWGGVLRQEAWDKDGPLLSIEDPFDRLGQGGSRGRWRRGEW